MALLAALRSRTMAADAPNSSSEGDLLDGVLHAQYTNTLDGTSMYVIMTANEHNGMLYEVHGLSVSDDLASEFRPLEVRQP